MKSVSRVKYQYTVRLYIHDDHEGMQLHQWRQRQQAMMRISL